MRFDILKPSVLTNNWNRIHTLSAAIPDDYWTIENYLRELPQKWDYSFLGINEDIIVGFVIASALHNDFHIHRIIVDKDFQQKGFGKMMMNHCLELAAVQKIKKISLKVSCDNLTAIKFYLDYNFRLMEVDIPKKLLVFSRFD